LTGNWFGLRDTFAGWGITPTITYAADLLANPIGGQRRGQAYASDFLVEVDLDLAKLAGITGLSAQVSGNWATGTNLSDDIGNFFQVAQYFEGDRLRLSTLFLRQTFFDGRLDLKAGRFATGDDFLTSPIGVSLVNEALNPILFAVQANVPGVTAYPNATWGGRVIARPVDAVTLSAGAFYSDPFLDPLEASGVEFAIPRAGYFTIGRLSPQRRPGPQPARALPRGRLRLNLYTLANPGSSSEATTGSSCSANRWWPGKAGPGRTRA
jgi:porin